MTVPCRTVADSLNDPVSGQSLTSGRSDMEFLFIMGEKIIELVRQYETGDSDILFKDKLSNRKGDLSKPGKELRIYIFQI